MICDGGEQHEVTCNSGEVSPYSPCTEVGKAVWVEHRDKCEAECDQPGKQRVWWMCSTGNDGDCEEGQSRQQRSPSRSRASGKIRTDAIRACFEQRSSGALAQPCNCPQAHGRPVATSVCLGVGAPAAKPEEIYADCKGECGECRTPSIIDADWMQTNCPKEGQPWDEQLVKDGCAVQCLQPKERKITLSCADGLVTLEPAGCDAVDWLITYPTCSVTCGSGWMFPQVRCNTGNDDDCKMIGQ